MDFNENKNYSNRSSLLSERIKSIPSLNDSREIVLENLNGTYSHGIFRFQVSQNLISIIRYQT